MLTFMINMYCLLGSHWQFNLFHFLLKLEVEVVDSWLAVTVESFFTLGFVHNFLMIIKLITKFCIKFQPHCEVCVALLRLRQR